MLDKVSVVIPAFNHANYLREALVSVFASRNVDVEVIVIDDGSTDHTEMVVRDFPKAVYVKQKNEGAHSAINHGLSIAANKYLAILNDDDLYSPDYLFNSLRILKVTGLEIVATPPQLMGSGEKLSQLMKHMEVASNSVNQLGIILSLLRSNWFVSTSGLIITKNVFQKNMGFRNLPMTHDLDFIIRATFDLGFSLARNTSSHWYYRCHGSNSSSNISISQVKNELNEIMQLPARVLLERKMRYPIVSYLLGNGLSEIDKKSIFEQLPTVVNLN